MQRKPLPCVYEPEGCTFPRYAKKRCAGHYLLDFPRQRPEKSPAIKPRPAKKAKPRNDIPTEVRQIVWVRSGDRCESCGEPLRGRVHMHHRLRRRDGLHVASNLVSLHPDCHVVAPQAVHQRPTWAKERGLIVPFWAEPAETVLVLSSGRRMLLDDVGGYLPPTDGVLYAA
jgi:hypothetical protein